MLDDHKGFVEVQTSVHCLVLRQTVLDECECHFCSFCMHCLVLWPTSHTVAHCGYYTHRNKCQQGDSLLFCLVISAIAADNVSSSLFFFQQVAIRCGVIAVPKVAVAHTLSVNKGSVMQIC